MKTSTVCASRSRAVVVGTLMVTSALFILSAQADEKAEQTPIPATSVAILESIDHEAADLARTIESGRLGDVHHHAFAIRDLVAALPAHSASLPADKLAAVKASGKFVAILAERLDATGDANDKAATAMNFKKLQDQLKSLRDNYPSSAAK